MTALEPTVAAVVRQQTGVAWSRARSLCAEGRVTVNGERWLDAASRVPPGAMVVVDPQARKLRAGPLAASAIVFADRDLVVVDKPAGMLSVADEPDNTNTLAHHTRTLLRAMSGRASTERGAGMRGRDARPGVADGKLGVVHRLDKDTSGLMVFARNATAQRALAAQFRAHDIDRVYHAIAHGAVRPARVETYLVPDRGDGLRGSYGHFRRAKGDIPADAKHAVTHVEPLESLAGATLVECRLETGRQHQIRIHLAELGHPLVGERVYIRDYASARIDAPRPMLHARILGYTHPRTRQRMSFECQPPEDFRRCGVRFGQPPADAARHAMDRAHGRVQGPRSSDVGVCRPFNRWKKAVAERREGGPMAVQLDHLMVPCRDKIASAKLLAHLLGVPWAESGIGPFAPVFVNDGLTLDFDETDQPFPLIHYAFRVDEDDFDAVLGRIKAAGIAYRSKVHGPVDRAFDTEHGGRIVYWNEPDGHQWEILTQSYARQPK